MSVPRYPENLASPSLSLLVKLGSIIVHADEYLSADSHEYDQIAFRQTLKDEEVQTWLKQMSDQGLLPVKRK